jgi:MFS family permease
MKSERIALLIIFALEYVFLVVAWVLSNLNAQYSSANEIEGALFLSAAIISFVISALAALRYGLRFSARKSLLVTILLIVTAFVLYSAGQWIIIKTSRN